MSEADLPTAAPVLLAYEVQDTDETLQPIAANAVRIEQAIAAVELYDRFGLAFLLTNDSYVVFVMLMNLHHGLTSPQGVTAAVMLAVLVASAVAVRVYADRPVALIAGAAHLMLGSFGWILLFGPFSGLGGAPLPVRLAFCAFVFVFGAIGSMNSIRAWQRVRFVQITPVMRERVKALRAAIITRTGKAAPGAVEMRPQKVPFLARDKTWHVARIGELVGIDLGRHPKRPRFRFAPAASVRIGGNSGTFGIWRSPAEIVWEGEIWPILIYGSDWQRLKSLLSGDPPAETGQDS